MAEYKKDEFRRKFPKLAQEMEGTGTVRVDAIRTSAKEAEKAAHTVQGYEPTVVDFIRRCESDKQALEIINFLEDRGKIESNYAKRLRAQLARRGLRSFGSKKNLGCYEQG
ncbi:MAG: DUF2095 family protein [Candidatus Hadarchaeota archaeon]|nr:DUF2095 family protein [Candidatus Hadarchaeota archaeon]